MKYLERSRQMVKVTVRNGNVNHCYRIDSIRSSSHFTRKQSQLHSHGIPLSVNLRSHLIFGANTDVGKTVITAGLVQDSLRSNRDDPYHKTRYVKPLQCGGADAAFVARYASQWNSWNDSSAPSMNETVDIASIPNGQNVCKDKFETMTLFEWDTPASPHFASRWEKKPVTDEDILQAVQMILASPQSRSSSSPSAQPLSEESLQACTTFVETAGGVLSPASSSPGNNRVRHARTSPLQHSHDSLSWGWSTQADLYQPLHLPVLLVGDSKLGGISSTLSALESLILRGYDVHGIVFFDPSQDMDNHTSSSNYYGNNMDAIREYVSRTFKMRSGTGRHLFENPEKSIVSLPKLPPHSQSLDEWFDHNYTRRKFHELNELLRLQWNCYVTELMSMRKNGRDVIWWPFTQHAKYVTSTVQDTKINHNNSEWEKDNDVTLIDGASGDQFSVISGPIRQTWNDTADPESAHVGTVKDSQIQLQRNSQFDACASWWTQGLGHGESSLALAAAAAAGRYGHVIFPEAVHAPAVKLCNLLLGPTGPGHGWADRVFFSDNGSTAMEIAIKMGMKKFCFDRELDLTQIDQTNLSLSVCAQQDCYHGDTLGAMDVAESNVFNKGQHPWFQSRGLFLSAPTVRFMDGQLGISFPAEYDMTTEKTGRIGRISDIYDVRSRLSSSLYKLYHDVIQKDWNSFEHKNSSRLIATVIIEPLLLGAGGMKFIDPLWQRALVDVARNHSVPVVYDEVASGLHRLGVQSCRQVLGLDPDIAAYAKLLTGGIVPMSVTLASKAIFDAFLGDSKSQALLHGHSYTAHPVGCLSAIHAIETYNTLYGDQKNTFQSAFDEEQVSALSELDLVQECMSLGTILSVKIRPDATGGGYNSISRTVPLVKKLREKGCYARPLGNIIYLMSSPLTNRNDCSRLLETVSETIAEAGSCCRHVTVTQTDQYSEPIV